MIKFHDIRYARVMDAINSLLDNLTVNSEKSRRSFISYKYDIELFVKPHIYEDSMISQISDVFDNVVIRDTQPSKSSIIQAQNHCRNQVATSYIIDSIHDCDILLFLNKKVQTRRKRARNVRLGFMSLMLKDNSLYIDVICGEKGTGRLLLNGIDVVAYYMEKEFIELSSLLYVVFFYYNTGFRFYRGNQCDRELNDIASQLKHMRFRDTQHIYTILESDNEEDIPLQNFYLRLGELGYINNDDEFCNADKFKGEITKRKIELFINCVNDGVYMKRPVKYNRVTNSVSSTIRTHTNPYNTRSTTRKKIKNVSKLSRHHKTTRKMYNNN